MVEQVTIDGQSVNPEQVLRQVISLSQSSRRTDAFSLFRKLAATKPAIPGFNFIKALYLQGCYCSFIFAEALRRELEISSDHQDAKRLLEQAEKSLRADPAQLTKAFPSPLIFSVVIVVDSDWRQTRTAIRAVLSQHYPYLEIVVVQREPDAAVAQALSALDPRVRVLEAYGKTFWQAIEYGLQSSTGSYQMVVPNSSVVFSDSGLLVLAVLLQRTPKVDFIAGSRGYLDELGFPESFRIDSPKFTRETFLDERNFTNPVMTLDFTGVVWSSRLFRLAGNRLATDLKQAVDFELFTRFFREVELLSVGMPISISQKPSLMRSELLSVEYVKEALPLLREERLVKPPLHKEHLTQAFISLEDIYGKSATPVLPAITYPPPPSTAVGRFLMSKAPAISLVMPSYNQGHFLEQAIDSILSQGYPRLELMIIDGGSTDDSVEIIKKYEKYLTYWCSEKDAGQYFAIQKGFDRSTGEVMGWLNSDDKLGQSALVYLGLIFLVYPHIRWVSGRGGSSITKSGAEVFALETATFSRERYLEEGFDKPYIQQEGTFWRRSLWEESGGSLDLRYSLAADCELWHRFFRFSQLNSVDLPIGLFREHAEQRSQLLRIEYLREATQVVRAELELLHRGLYTEMLPAPAILTHADIMAAAEERAAR